MSNGGVAAAAAAAAATIEAIKASGVVVRVQPEVFRSLLARAEGALVVRSEGGLFSTKYRYLISYKGFAFFTKSSEPISLPAPSSRFVPRRSGCQTERSPEPARLQEV